VLGYSPLEGCGIQVQEQDGGADKSLAHVGRRVVRRMPGAVGFITRFKRLKSNYYYMRLGRARGLQLILREKCCTDYSQREHRRPVSTGSCSFFLVTRILPFSLRCSWHSARFRNTYRNSNLQLLLGSVRFRWNLALSFLLEAAPSGHFSQHANTCAGL
jgi:hypothetical protein